MPRPQCVNIIHRIVCVGIIHLLLYYRQNTTESLQYPPPPPPPPFRQGAGHMPQMHLSL
jgi:hypothetical protein